MPRMVIISPEPESARMLALAFDLHGFEVGLAANLQELRRLPRHEEVELTLLDLIDAADARQPGLKRGQIPGRLIVIAPHGMTEEEARRRYVFADLVVRRPYELLSLVNLAEQDTTWPPSPPRTVPKWKKAAGPRKKKRPGPGKKSVPRKKAAPSPRPLKSGRARRKP